MRAVFIRAPWVERVGAGVQVLARAAGHVVAVRQGSKLATAFHPEMTGDRRIHQFFVDIVKGTPELARLSLRRRHRVCAQGADFPEFRRQRIPDAISAAVAGRPAPTVHVDSSGQDPEEKR